jgi:predicted O-methyltransferase YrrM
MRHKPIKLAEIGIYHNMSMCCWRKFFPQATLYGLDFNKGFIDNAVSHNLDNTHYSSIDVTNKQSILAAFDQLNTKLDIIIDDSTHQPTDQINVVVSCLDYLNSGGYLIIEDLFKKVDLSTFTAVLDNLRDIVVDYFFIDANHKNKFSGQWDNDRLLIIIRK